MSMSRRLLPIGIQSFRSIREDDFYYVDKTPLIHQLVSQGRHYFLSRPRRFGKSLLLDTMGELFAGKESLFRGLHIHDRWDWDKAHPVVRLSFAGNYDEPGALHQDLLAQLAIIERNAGLAPGPEDLAPPSRLRDLLDRLHHKTGQGVAVLVDEYDKPILDVLGDPDMAKANRDHLRGFYGIIKDSAEHVRFTFVTGISMFSKVSLFSGLNNLKNISLDPRFATICGYTDGDLDEVFAPELPGLDRDEIRLWYNGYHWRGDERVYNPFDILLLFDTRQFSPHWYETGTPTFLYETLMAKGANPLELENRPIGESQLTKFDVEDIDPGALMFQTGYLTIAAEERRGVRTFYRLESPNLEVRASFSEGFLVHLGRNEAEASEQGNALLERLETNDFDGFREQLHACLAGLPHQWRDSGYLGQYESHYAAMLYLTFRAVGADVRAEEASLQGRADMVLLHGGQVFILEFKMAKDGQDAEAAMAEAMGQMRRRGYADKYRAGNELVHLIGVVFGSQERNLLAVRAEPA